jgi:hypothetical protein
MMIVSMMNMAITMPTTNGIDWDKEKVVEHREHLNPRL